MRPSTSFWKGLQEVSLFFQGKDEVHKSLRRLVKRLERAGIRYAVVGGLALKAHQYMRTTRDVDILLTSDGLVEFRRRFVPKDYEAVVGRSRRFTDRKNRVTIDILLTGAYPGRGNPGPVSFPDPAAVSESVDNICVITLAPLVQLKLAARRYKDFGDVVELIRANDLDESFQERLDPSLRRDYIACLEEKRREDEYEARNG